MHRICYLASDPVPSEAANSIHVAHMCDALAGAGYAVTLIAPVPRVQLVDRLAVLREMYGIKGRFDEASILQLNFRGGDWLRRRLLSLVLWRAQPDLVYGRHLNNCLVAARHGYPTVFEAHTPAREREIRFQNDFEALIGQDTFQALVVISRALADAFLTEYPDLEDRIIVAHDSAPEWPLPSTAADRPDFGNSLKVTYVGSLYPGKGMELLVRLAPLCPWAQFTVVGGGEREIVHWRSALSAGTTNLTFLGRVPHAQVYRHMVTADVLVAPYQYEVKVHGTGGDVAQWMSPLKVFEYMAAARPMIASDLPVLREVLEHERNALLVDPENPDAWRLAMEKIRTSPELGVEIAKRAYDDYRHQYTWRARVQRVMDALQHL